MSNSSPALTLPAPDVATSWIPVPDLPPVEELQRAAAADALMPIAPGGNGAPFWNTYAQRFLSVPSFDFAELPGAVSYRFTVTGADEEKREFSASTPSAPLTAVWNELPVGFTKVEVAGIAADGAVCGMSGERRFYRAAMFRGGYSRPVDEYRQSARRAMEFLFRQPHCRNWLRTGRPDPDYELYCYPSKIISGVVAGMLLYARLEPAQNATALEIARRAADYLIDCCEPAGAPLEFMPPTYAGTARTAGEYAGEIMMIYPAESALVWLDLYDATGERRYFDAALRVARSYLKLQLPSGSWYLKIRAATGEPVAPNQCVPMPMIVLLERLTTQYGVAGFRTGSEKALAYLEQTAVRNFNWEGQFEDIAPAQPYRNNTKHNACDYALYLLRHLPATALPHGRDAALETARILLRYAEDQFVVWERPMPCEPWRTDQWITPCVLEQYAYPVPIDASAAKLIMTFQAMFEATGNMLDLAKACELANAMTRAQDFRTGRYLTYWENNERGADPGWINCAVASAGAMVRLGNLLAERMKSFKSHGVTA